MRKCVSMVAVASAAFGVAACSASGQHREPAGAARPLSGQAAPGPGSGSASGAERGSQGTVRAGAAHAAPIAAAPAVPAASGAVPARSAAQAPNPQPAPGARHDPATAVAAPVLVPSGTTDILPQPARPRTDAARPASAAPAPAAPVAPAPPRPAPPPPPARDQQHAQDPNIGYDPNASAIAQIIDAVAAARADGKAVLLDFGANWCTACRALDNAMHTPKAQAVLARSYHVVKIDLGNADPQHMQLANQYAAYGTFGMPLLVVLNPDGTVRANSALNGQPKYTEADLAAWLTQWAPR